MLLLQLAPHAIPISSANGLRQWSVIIKQLLLKSIDLSKPSHRPRKARGGIDTL